MVEYRIGNEFICGSTRSGKSVSQWEVVTSAAERGDVSILICDPHEKSLAYNCFQQLIARGFEHRIIYDQLHSCSHTLGYRFLKQSQARNPLQRKAENQETARGFCNILCRHGGINITSQPQKEEWTLKAISFVLEQSTERSADFLKYAFKPKHPKFQSLLKGCTEPELVFEFTEIAEGNIKTGTYQSAQRLIEATCNSIPFQMRCGTSFDLEEFIEDAGILIVEGGIDATPMGIIMGAIQMKIISHVRRRPNSTPRVLMILDEANNLRLVTDVETRAMAECQKMGLDIHVLVQLLDFPSAAVCNGVLSNCVRHEWFWNANPNVISKAMEDLGLSRADGQGTSAIRELQVGERWIKQRTPTSEKVWKERVQMLGNPWGFGKLASIKTHQALSRIRKRPEYIRHSDVDSENHDTANVHSIDNSVLGKPTSMDRLRNRQNNTESS